MRHQTLWDVLQGVKNWIARKNETPAIIKMINSFNEYWANAIALVNQTNVPASQYGYSMAAMDDNALFASYRESLANFGAAYAATQESIKTQATSLAHPAVLHECRTTTPTQHLHPHSTTAHVQQLFWQTQQR
jgi:hypothetical protein